MNLRAAVKTIFSYYNLFRFWSLETFISFDAANQFIQRVDKRSLQIILKSNGAVIGKNCDIETGIIFHNCEDYQNLSIGDNCHIGKSCFFDLRDKINIESNVTISMQCTFITHMDTGNSSLNSFYPSSQSPVYIRNNVYIGVRSTLLQGITIGQSVIIAAGSIVKESVKDKMFVGGVPAKRIK